MLVCTQAGNVRPMPKLRKGIRMLRSPVSTSDADLFLEIPLPIPGCILTGTTSARLMLMPKPRKGILSLPTPLSSSAD
jgi:hypothetical protein